jgi:MFS family permease
LISLFGVAGPIGFAVGPFLGGILVDGLGWSLSACSGSPPSCPSGRPLSSGSARPRFRPAVIPTGRCLPPCVRRGAGVCSTRGPPDLPDLRVAFLASQMSRPYQPLIVEEIVGRAGPRGDDRRRRRAGRTRRRGHLPDRLAGSCDRIGFRPVLITALVIGGIA